MQYKISTRNINKLIHLYSRISDNARLVKKWIDGIDYHYDENDPQIMKILEDINLHPSCYCCYRHSRTHVKCIDKYLYCKFLIMKKAAVYIDSVYRTSHVLIVCTETKSKRKWSIKNMSLFNIINQHSIIDQHPSIVTYSHGKIHYCPIYSCHDINKNLRALKLHNKTYRIDKSASIRDRYVLLDINEFRAIFE
jgi:hypothetical protein